MRLCAALMVLFLAGCTVPVQEFTAMTPEQCRMYGVAVHDSDIITGEVVRSEFHTLAGVEDICGEIYGQLVNGCARDVDQRTFPSPTHQYWIVYAEHKCIPFHEYCHAIYERRGHTVTFNLRAMQGDILAACP